MEQTDGKQIESREELRGIVRSSLVENGIYEGMPFMFLCAVEEGETYIDSIKICDWEHDAEQTVDHALENGWVFCHFHKEAYEHAERVIFPQQTEA